MTYLATSGWSKRDIFSAFVVNSLVSPGVDNNWSESDQAVRL
jgi:hypothetical protein